MKRETIKSIAKTTGMLYIYSGIRRWLDNTNSDRFECSVGDILLLRDVPSHNQLLLTSRLLDVEDYLSGRDQTFPWQNTISRKAYGEKHREADGNRSFKSLIESYQKDGYHADSFITCDREMNLMDGNHRMGLHIYEKIEKVNVRRVHRSIPFKRGGDWYYDQGISTEFMESLYTKFEEIQLWLQETGNTFCAYFKGSDEDRANLTKSLIHLATVLKVFDCEDSNETIVQFRMQQPAYTVMSGELVSERANVIEEILQKRSSKHNEIVVTKNCLEGKKMFEKYVK